MLVPGNAVVIPHVRPDGDAVGSVLGLAQVLDQLNHRVAVISPTEYPADFRFLPDTERILVATEQPVQAEKLLGSADLIFVLDCGTLERIGSLGQLVEQSNAVKINIDHHKDFEAFTPLAFRDVYASSTCELVFRLVREAGLLDMITPACADALYLGMLTDTGGFRFPSTTSHLHRMVADLIDKGANFPRIYNELFNQNSENRTRLLGYALCEGLTVLAEQRTAYIKIPLAVQRQWPVGVGGTEGFVNYGLTIKGNVLSVLMLEEEDRIKMSFRSVGSFPANDLAKHFQGGGHHNAAGGKSLLSLAETEAEFLRILASYQEQLVSPEA
jgi:phosphoesterase RecJ-like protein